jgi:cell wall-associated NlpC family hydrolase
MASAMRRLAVVGFCFAVLVAPAWGANSRQSWAQPQIALVTSRGLFPGTPANFQPAAPLTATALDGLVAGVGGRPASQATDPAQPVSIEQLDATLVDALGLDAAARDFFLGAVNAGLNPPARFGTEVVARLLGLRANHPASQDALELQPQQTATRADAAFSAARLLALAKPARGVPAPAAASTSTVAAAAAGAGVQYVQQLAATFALPVLTAWQQQVLQTAVSLIGYPYVWGGDDETVEPGFDCSGLVWRVYKLASYSEAPQLADTLKGRTAAAMAGEVPKTERIAIADLQPGDVLFIGHGPKSKPAQINHAAIYLGNGWLIESSGQGVALGQLDWYRKSFAWGRRPLAEAGLEGVTSSAPSPQAA